MADGLPILIEFDSASTAAEVWSKTLSMLSYFLYSLQVDFFARETPAPCREKEAGCRFFSMTKNSKIVHKFPSNLACIFSIYNMLKNTNSPYVEIMRATFNVMVKT